MQLRANRLRRHTRSALAPLRLRRSGLGKQRELRWRGGLLQHGFELRDQRDALVAVELGEILLTPFHGGQPIGHLWRSELAPTAEGATVVTHTYDWTDLHDESRLGRARATTSERLAASVDRLAALAESTART